VDPKTQAMENIQKRLGGHDTELKSTSILSVSGQVNEVIDQATSTANLASMYIWWMPWF